MDIILNNIKYTFFSLFLRNKREQKYFLVKIIQKKDKAEVGLTLYWAFTIKTNITEKNEDSQNSNYVNLSHHDFVFTLKNKRIKKERDHVKKKE